MRNKISRPVQIALISLSLPFLPFVIIMLGVALLSLVLRALFIFVFGNMIKRDFGPQS